MKSSNSLSLLLNPFNRIAGWKAFLLGIVIVIATVLIGSVNDMWFGFLDVKFAPGISLLHSFLCQTIGLSSVILLMYAGTHIFAKNVRFQDVLGTTVLARFPFLLAALSGFLVNKQSLNTMTDALLNGTFSILSNVGFIVSSFIMLLASIWYIALLYNSFKVSANIKGAKNVFLFIGIVVLSEILSLVLIYLISKIS